MPTPLRDTAYHAIKREITSGAWAPGTQLQPPELAANLAMSRTPVRDALNALQQEGLVEVLPRRGYFVSRVTIRDVEEVFDLRLILESASARRAATLISLAEIERLAALSRGYTQNEREGYLAYLRENRDFHLAIAAATGNRLLHETLARVLDHIQRFLILRLDLAPDADEQLAEHQALLDAFRRREADAAEALMRTALERARSAVLESIFRHAKDWAL